MPDRIHGRGTQRNAWLAAEAALVLTRIMRRAAILPALLLLVACSPLSEEKDEFRAALLRWHDADIHSYSYTFRYGCFCHRAGRFAVVVEDDSIVSVELVDGGWDEEAEPWALTVPQMFAEIDEALDENPDDATLRFAELGYPISVGFDRWEDAVDDEWGMGIEDFVVMD